MTSGFERLVAKKRRPPHTPGAALQGDYEPGVQHIQNEMRRQPGVPQYIRGQRDYDNPYERFNQRTGRHGRKRHRYT